MGFTALKEEPAATGFTPVKDFTPLAPERSAALDLNETLNVAGFDTGIPINPELSAYLTALGGGMSGSYRGIRQMLGDKTQAEDQGALRRLEADPTVGGYAKTGAFIGAGMDPVTLALPVSKGKSLLDMAKYGAVGGGVAGFLNPLAEGDSRTINTATGAVAGGLLAPVLGAAVSRGRIPIRSPQEVPAPRPDPLRLGYQQDPIIVNPAGEAGTEAQMFARKYAPQPGDVPPAQPPLLLEHKPPSRAPLVVDQDGNVMTGQQAKTAEQAAFEARMAPQAADSTYEVGSRGIGLSAGQEATKDAAMAQREATTRTLAPDLTNPDMPINQVLARRRAAGEIGNINPQLAAQIGGGAVGAATGALTADENASPAEIASRALIGGVAGWQLAKYGANKIMGYKAPEVTRAGAPAASSLADAVNVVGDAAEPLFKSEAAPETTKRIATLAKEFFGANPGLRDPSRLISDDIFRYVAGGSIPPEQLAQHGLNPETFARAWRDSISDHARSLAYLRNVMPSVMEGLTPEQQAIMREAGSTLEDGAYVRPFWKKVTDLWRGLLVTQPATAVRNAETQVGRVGLDVIQAPIDSWLQRLTGRKVNTQPLDGLEEVYSVLFRKNKGEVDHILSAFPKEKARLFNQYLSDVEVAARDGKVWGAIDQGVQAANILNRSQEFIVRRGIFQNALDVELRNAGLDLSTIIKNNELGKIPQAAVRNAVETSLSKTFAETPAWGTASRKVIDAINAVPGANLAIPFPRFMYNAFKFQYQYSPMGVLSYLSPAERAAFAAGDTSKVSKAIIGTGLLGAAFGMRNSEHAGEKWYEYTKDNGSVVDLRPFNPFASYLFAADVLKKQRDGTLYKLTSGDVAQGLLATNMRAGTGLYLLDNALNLISKTADEQKLSDKAKEFTGDMLGGFLTPLNVLRDAYDQFTDGQSTLKDTRQEPFLGALKSHIPVVSQSLPDAAIPTREGPKVTEDPLLRQATGLSVSGPKNPLEKELDRLGFDRRSVLANTGDKEVDRLYSQAMGSVVEKFLVPVVEGEKFKAMSDSLKGVVLEAALGEFRNMVKKGVNESLPADKQMALEVKKQPPRVRLLLKDLGLGDATADPNPDPVE